MFFHVRNSSYHCMVFCFYLKKIVLSNQFKIKRQGNTRYPVSPWRSIKINFIHIHDVLCAVYASALQTPLPSVVPSPVLFPAHVLFLSLFPAHALLLMPFPVRAPYRILFPVHLPVPSDSYPRKYYLSLFHAHVHVRSHAHVL